MLTKQEISYNRSQAISMSPATLNREVASLTEQLSSQFNSLLMGALEQFLGNKTGFSMIDISLNMICEPVWNVEISPGSGTMESLIQKSSKDPTESKLVSMKTPCS